MDRQLMNILRLKRQNAYDNPNSVLKEFDAFLEINGIYHSFNDNLFVKQIAKRKELCDFTLQLYSKAKLDNERELLLYCLFHMGYSKNILAKMVLDIFKHEKDNAYLWHYADLLYFLKEYAFLNDYIKLIMDKSYGASREMLILLVGESSIPSVVPYLILLSQEKAVLGHVLTALYKFNDPQILPLMKKNINNPQKWVADIAKSYMSAH